VHCRTKLLQFCVDGFCLQVVQWPAHGGKSFCLVSTALVRPSAWQHTSSASALVQPHDGGGGLRAGDDVDAAPLVIDTVKLAEPSVLPTSAPPGTCAKLHGSGGANAPCAASCSPSSRAPPSQPADLPQLVLRLYEPRGCRGRAALKVGGGLRVRRAALGNLLEDELASLPVPATCGSDNSMEQVYGLVGPIGYGPFQVLTVLLWLQ
jgi:hypothetical protein